MTNEELHRVYWGAVPLRKRVGDPSPLTMSLKAVQKAVRDEAIADAQGLVYKVPETRAGYYTAYESGELV